MARTTVDDISPEWPYVAKNRKYGNVVYIHIYEVMQGVYHRPYHLRSRSLELTA